MGLSPSWAAAWPATNSSAAQIAAVMYIYNPLEAVRACQQTCDRRQCRQVWLSMKALPDDGSNRVVFMGLMRAALIGTICLLGLAAGIAPAPAADYPNRPVRWLIGFAAGGPVDIVARIMGQW